MLLLATRIAEQVLFPPGIFILLGLVVLWLTRHHRRFGSFLLVLIFLSLWLVSTPWFSHKLIDSLQNQYAVLPHMPAEADSIVVLGGGTTVSGNSQQLSTASLERLYSAAMLAKKSGLPVITTGGKVMGVIRSEASLMAEMLKNDFQIPVDIIEEDSKTTWEHPVNLKPLLEKAGFKKPIIVTHAWHIPRAMFSFQQLQLDAIPGPPLRVEKHSIEHTIFQYLPGARSLEQTRIALHEWLGMLVYQLRVNS